MNLFFLCFLLLTSLSACDVQRQAEDYQIRELADLELNSINHPHGFAQSECFACHVSGNIHLVDRLKAPSFPLARPLVEAQGLASCRGCHGTNGVQP